MKKKLSLLAVLPLLSLASCQATMSRSLRENFTGTTTGVMRQKELGKSVTNEQGNKIKDEKFYFSVTITAEDSKITGIEWTDTPSLCYTKSSWKPETIQAIEEGSIEFLHSFIGRKFEVVYTNLVGDEDLGEIGANVKFDDATFARGVNDSVYKYWTKSSYDAGGNDEIKSKGLLVEIGIVNAIYLAITK